MICGSTELLVTGNTEIHETNCIRFGRKDDVTP